jgi:hypothetical protein
VLRAETRGKRINSNLVLKCRQASSGVFAIRFSGVYCMDGYRKADRVSSFSVDVVTAVNAQQLPAAALDQARKLATGNRLHTAISRI